MPEPSYTNSFVAGEIHGWSVTSDDTQNVAQKFKNLGYFTQNLAGGPVATQASSGHKDSLSANTNDCAAVGLSDGVDGSLRKDGAETGGDGERWIWVLDPHTRKLRVPLTQLVHTQATATTGTVPSLCISFLEGRCRHQWCRQAHVLSYAIPQLRYEALNAPTCCRVHKDPHDTSVLTKRFKYIRIVNHNNSNVNMEVNGNGKLGCGNGDVGGLIPTDRVAQTVGLLRFMAHNVPQPKKKQQKHFLQPKERSSGKSVGFEEVTGECDKDVTKDDTDVIDDDCEEILELPAKLICRLHLAHRCRYLEDCNNIHICREYELQLQPPPHVMSILSSVGPATRTVTIGDACYAVTTLSVGEVSDEKFRTMCEQQRLAARSPLWNEAQSAILHRSPMMYGAGGPSPYGGATNTPSPLVAGKWISENSSNATAATNGCFLNAGACSFPARSENGQSGGNSPIISSAQQHTGIHSAPHGLRIYDIRPKAAQPNTLSGSFTNNGTNSNNSANKHGTGSCGVKSNLNCSNSNGFSGFGGTKQSCAGGGGGRGVNSNSVCSSNSCNNNRAQLF